MNEFKFLKENVISSLNFKGPSPATPLWKEKVLLGAMIVELTIPKVTTLSTQKRDCEKYLFRRV